MAMLSITNILPRSPRARFFEKEIQEICNDEFCAIDEVCACVCGCVCCVCVCMVVLV